MKLYFLVGIFLNFFYIVIGYLKVPSEKQEHYFLEYLTTSEISYDSTGKERTVRDSKKNAKNFRLILHHSFLISKKNGIASNNQHKYLDRYL